jgi:4-hydroxy-3-polyprenylbenzoate decarboxylase
MRKLLESQQIPITGVYMLPESTHHLVVVGVKNAYPGIAHQIGHLVFGSKLAPWFHQVMVVDDKTDIYNINELIHDFCTKLHPSRGIHIYTSHVGTPLYPFASPEDRKYGRGDKVLFDCLFPLDWPLAETPIKVIFSNKDIYPEDVQQKVLGSWKSYGFKD